mmetsp:Transcript_3064/g.4128  ORF Transcript_3064/g.4128 Transcript_3064/m.4128 type:complete len:169 (+) Transcript_3064:93-599(+)|eukprot:CAMPEP_0198151152 /NCGR_PEP_ID=MMETSP1443-20131203/54454_1 /TAXON_ID=186043 /ORGANISM="Entomoneis sp., Strain CCMP2396" /LENGTH=168 /DNA_ID=CAMNT_0043816729 /DNA_START=66 /DNA_END=572 /DNA_ORIENTATION=+
MTHQNSNSVNNDCRGERGEGDHPNPLHSIRELPRTNEIEANERLSHEPAALVPLPVARTTGNADLSLVSLFPYVLPTYFSTISHEHQQGPEYSSADRSMHYEVDRGFTVDREGNDDVFDDSYHSRLELIRTIELALDVVADFDERDDERDEVAHNGDGPRGSSGPFPQ